MTAPAPQTRPPPAPRPRPAVALRVAALALVLLAVPALLLATGFGARLLASGLAALSGGQVRVQVAGGTLLGPLDLDKLEVRQQDLTLEASQLRLDWHPARLRSGRLHIGTLSAARLEITTRPTDTPASTPSDLSLPLPLQVDALTLGELVLRSARGEDAATETLRLSALSATLESDGRRHRLGALAMRHARGTLTGAAELDGHHPFPLQARAHAAATADGHDFRVDAQASGTLLAPRIEARAEGADFEGTADLALAPFAVQPLGHAQIAVARLNPAAFATGAPKAQFQLSLDLAPPPDGAPHALSGHLQARNSAPARLDQGGLPLTRLHARVDWAADTLRLNALALEAGQSQRATGQATWAAGKLEARLALQDLDAADWHSRLKSTRLSGPLTLRADAREQALTATLQDPRFGLALDLARDPETLTLRQIRLTGSRGGALELSGTLTQNAQAAFAAEGRLRDFDPSAFVTAPRASLNGQLTARGQLKPPATGALELSLAESRLWAQGQAYPLSGQLALNVEGDRLTRAEALLDLAGNHLQARGNLGAAGDRLHLTLDAPALDRLGLGLAGGIKGSAALQGRWQELAASVRVEAGALTLAGGHQLARCELMAELGAGPQGRLDIQMDLRDYRRGDTEIPQASLSAQGTRAEHAIRLTGRFGEGNAVSAAGQGGLTDKGWQGQLTQLALDGRWRLALQHPAPLQVSRERVALGQARLTGPDLEAVLADTVWTPQETRTKGELLRLQPLRAGTGAQGATPLRLAGGWDLRLAEQVSGTLHIARQDGDLPLAGDGTLWAGLTALQLRLDAAEGRLRARGTATGSRVGTLALEADAALARRADGWGLLPQGAVSGQLRLDTPDLAWAAQLAGGNWRSGGRLTGTLRLAGTAASPRLSGQVEGDGLSLTALDQGLYLEEGRLRLKLEGDQARLETLHFASPVRTRPAERRAVPELGDAPAEPPLQASGEIRLADGSGRFHIQAHHLPVLQLPGRWLMLTADTRLHSGPRGIALTGTVSADGGYFEMPRGDLPRLGDDVVVLGQETRRANKLPVAVDVEASLGDHLYFEGRGLETRLTGQLRLRSDGRTPLRATGSIRTRGGVFDAYGQKLNITRGILNFQGPLENPGLNVRALRRGLAVEAGVAITGSVNSPKVKLVSEPEVPDNEKLAWIVLGRGPDQAGGGDSAVLLAAATSILGGPGSGGGLTRQLAQNLGLDEVSLRAGDISSSDNRSPVHTVAGSTSSAGTVSGQVVSLGKRLSSDAYLSYEQSLSGLASIVKLTYALNRRASLVARAGTDNALDLVFTFVFK